MQLGSTRPGRAIEAAIEAAIGAMAIPGASPKTQRGAASGTRAGAGAGAASGLGLRARAAFLGFLPNNLGSITAASLRVGLLVRFGALVAVPPLVFFRPLDLPPRLLVGLVSPFLGGVGGDSDGVGCRGGAGGSSTASGTAYAARRHFSMVLALWDAAVACMRACESLVSASSAFR